VVQKVEGFHSAKARIKFERDNMMDNLGNESLLQAMEALRTDVANLRVEARAQHLATFVQLNGLSECIVLVNNRVAKLENQNRPRPPSDSATAFRELDSGSLPAAVTHVFTK
jgi:hypothetical protein